MSSASERQPGMWCHGLRSELRRGLFALWSDLRAARRRHRKLRKVRHGLSRASQRVSGVQGFWLRRQLQRGLHGLRELLRRLAVGYQQLRQVRNRVRHGHGVQGWGVHDGMRHPDQLQWFLRQPQQQHFELR